MLMRLIGPPINEQNRFLKKMCEMGESLGQPRRGGAAAGGDENQDNDANQPPPRKITKKNEASYAAGTVLQEMVQRCAELRQSTFVGRIKRMSHRRHHGKVAQRNKCPFGLTILLTDESGDLRATVWGSLAIRAHAGLQVNVGILLGLELKTKSGVW